MPPKQRRNMESKGYGGILTPPEPRPYRLEAILRGLKAVHSLRKKTYPTFLGLRIRKRLRNLRPRRSKKTQTETDLTHLRQLMPMRSAEGPGMRKLQVSYGKVGTDVCLSVSILQTLDAAGSYTCTCKGSERLSPPGIGSDWGSHTLSTKASTTGPERFASGVRTPYGTKRFSWTPFLSFDASRHIL